MEIAVFICLWLSVVCLAYVLCIWLEKKVTGSSNNHTNGAINTRDYIVVGDEVVSDEVIAEVAKQSLDILSSS